MNLGTFSISLAVRDLAVSLAFYQKLGFRKTGGDDDQGWLILINGNTKIGLFQGMFDSNILTFNPGWGPDGQPAAGSPDIREIQKQLKQAGIAPVSELDETTTGPASFMLTDPDGNTILLDQHV